MALPGRGRLWGIRARGEPAPLELEVGCVLLGQPLPGLAVGDVLLLELVDRARHVAQQGPDRLELLDAGIDDRAEGRADQVGDELRERDRPQRLPGDLAHPGGGPRAQAIAGGLCTRCRDGIASAQRTVRCRRVSGSCRAQGRPLAHEGTLGEARGLVPVVADELRAVGRDVLDMGTQLCLSRR